MSEERYEEIAQEAETKISEAAGKEPADYIQGLETAIGFLEGSLSAAKEDLEAEDDNG